MTAIKVFFTEFIPTAATHLGRRYTEIATQGIDDRDYRPVYLSHFIPCTCFDNRKDQTNGDQYSLWDDDRTIRLKCLALVGTTLFVHAIGVLLSLMNRIVKLVTLAHFWAPSDKDYPLHERAWTFIKDIARVVMTPIFYPLLELAALWGLLFPDNGRKLYATFERCLYGKELLAPCFQPNPTSHLGGASLTGKNVW